MATKPKKPTSEVTIPARKMSIHETPRRPEVKTRAEQIQAENPTWSWGTCLVTAKRELAKP